MMFGFMEIHPEFSVNIFKTVRVIWHRDLLDKTFWRKFTNVLNLLKSMQKRSSTRKEKRNWWFVDLMSKSKNQRKDSKETKRRGKVIFESDNKIWCTWQSRVVFFDEGHILLEWYTTTVVSINLVEVPLHHLFRYWEVQRFEGVLHQSSEFFYVDQFVFLSFLDWLLCLLSSFTKEVWELNHFNCTYSSNVILPSPSESMRLKCQSSWSSEISDSLTPRLSARRTLS